jgi:hypothetical protein
MADALVGLVTATLTPLLEADSDSLPVHPVPEPSKQALSEKDSMQVSANRAAFRYVIIPAQLPVGRQIRIVKRNLVAKKAVNRRKSNTQD